MTSLTHLAVVGVGLVGIRHIEAIKQAPNVRLSAVVDTSAAAQAIADSNKVPLYDSLDALFKEQVPDGVILSTPTVLHVEHGLQCIEKGCPILVEKPIATTAIDAQKLVSEGISYDVPILVGHHRRHNPLIHQAKTLIKTGKVGDVRSVQGTCWLYKPDDYFESAPWRTKIGAGPISVNLVHDIDLMRYLLGDIVRVQAAATKSARGFENEDVAAAVLTFANGAVGTISVSDSIVSPWSWELTARENPIYPPTSQSCLLVGGSEGSLSIPDLALWTHSGERSWWNPISATSIPQEFSDPLVNQVSHFADVIHRKVTPLVSGLEGLKTLQAIEAIQVSAHKEQSVDVEEMMVTE